MNRHPHTLQVALLLALGLLPTAALAQTGVSDDRVSLPEGPGSVEGIGDDAQLDTNMGQMTTSVPIALPPAHDGMAPALGLNYSSGGGPGIAGMGWDLPLMAIERLTLRRVPRYDSTDEFQADGQQLVYVGGDNPRTYRLRFEGSFVRYRWYEPDQAPSGGDYWTAELPDGRVATYGAEPDGSPVTSARVGGGEGTFRYLLREMNDVWGHRTVYGYTTSGTTSLLDSVSWAFVDGDATYAASLSYETREDWTINCSGGFEEVNDQRLTGVRITARGEQLRRYAFGYEGYDVSGGFSRLATVRLFGTDDSEYPAVSTFTYAQTLGTVCQDAARRPFSVGFDAAIGVNLKSGDAVVVDIDGDALPDIIESSQQGQSHRIWRNVMASDGSQTLVGPTDSANGTWSAHDFSSAYTQVLDANGDGFTDVMNAKTGSILYNRGTGDWDAAVNVWAEDASGLPDLNADFDATDGELTSLRFIDYDNDRLIDLVRSTGSGDSNLTTVYRNTGSAFEVDDSVEAIGLGFENDTMELNDINGDGLLDVVQVDTAEVRYRLNLGYGRWTTGWRTMSGSFSFSVEEAEEAELEDLNGDALADLVLVKGGQIQLWINENGRRFGSMQTLSSADVTGGLDGLDDVNVSVFFADMNGNGSSDVVWVSSGGAVSFCDLYPVRPNLLSRMENGIGRITEVTWGTSVEHMARDENAWAYRLPFPNAVVDQLLVTDALTGVERVTTYAYHDGFYDGDERLFRGFASAEEALRGESGWQEEGEVRRTWDLGVTDPYRAGLLMSEESWSGGELIMALHQEFTECDVTGAESATPFDARYLCLSARETELVERAAEADRRTVRTEFEYDGYGNVTIERELGVVDEVGDEFVNETQYIGEEGAGRWLINAPWLRRQYASADGRVAEQITYYDGDDFEGLPEGTLTHGSVSRTTVLADEGRLITVERFRSDAHGNTVELIDALGAPGSDDHRREWSYDETGLRIITSTVHLSGPEGAYQLEQDLSWDPVLDAPTHSSGWQVVRQDEVLSAGAEVSYGYDVFGRPTGVARAGDDLSAPTWEYRYTIEETGSRVELLGRSGGAGSEADSLTVRCFDGRGRVYQTRERVADGEWLVSGTTIFAPIDGELVEYFPYTTQTGECGLDQPDGTPAVRHELDAMGRVRVSRHPVPDGEALYLLEYGPLWMARYDRNDTDTGSAFYDTPTIRVTDGLGRLTSVGRTREDGDVEWFQMGWDDLNHLETITDPEGNVRTQSTDYIGRVTSVTDADFGTVTFDYDDLGQQVRRVDATGAATAWTYDAAGRITASWAEDDEASTRYEQVYDLDWAGECPTDGCGLGAGQLLVTRYPAGMDWRRYDARQRLEARGRLFGQAEEGEVESGAVELVLQTTFDNLGRVTAETWPDGVSMTREMDGAGRLTAVPGWVDTIGFDSLGHVTQLAYANGVTESWRWDEARRLSGIEVTGPDASVVYAVDIARDQEGWITALTDGSDASASGPSGSGTFGYDALGRLVRAELAPGTSDAELLTYTWDGADNLTARTSSVTGSTLGDGTRTIGRAHAVERAGDIAVTYDDRGFATRRGELSIDWDAFGRVRSVAHDDGRIQTHSYGHGGARVMSQSGETTTYYFTDDYVIEDGIATAWLELDGRSVARHDSAALATTVLTDVVADGRITAGDAWVAWAADRGYRAPLSDVSDTTHLLNGAAASALIDWGERRTWLHRDVVDTVAAVTDADGQRIERTVTYPFGAKRWSSAASTEDRTFTDKRADAFGALVHIGARLYDPQLARWISPDLKYETLDDVEDLDEPWEALGNYVYGWNTPLMGQDETGADLSPSQKTAMRALLAGMKALQDGSDGRQLEQAINNQVQRFRDANGQRLEPPQTILGGAELALQLVVKYREEVRELVTNGRAQDKRLASTFEAVLSDGAFRRAVLRGGLNQDFSSRNPSVASDTEVTVETWTTRKGKGKWVEKRAVRRVVTGADVQRGFQLLQKAEVRVSNTIQQHDIRSAQQAAQQGAAHRNRIRANVPNNGRARSGGMGASGGDVNGNTGSDGN